MLNRIGKIVCTLHKNPDLYLIFYSILEKYMQLTIILPTDEVHNIEVFKDASVEELMIQLKVRLPLHDRILLLDIKSY